MEFNSYQNIKSLIYSILDGDGFKSMKQSRKNFIVTALLCFACIKGKMNFLQMQRWR